MQRRTFIAGVTSVASAGLAGCLEDTGVSATGSDDHPAALRDDVDERGVEVHSVEVDDGVAAVEHGYEKPNDAVANVAMAFVDRVAAGWAVDRLDGYLVSDGSKDYAWHAEAEWAQEYADGEIGPEEYGKRISGTLSVVLTRDSNA